MSKSFPPRRFEPSAEILAAAKTRLPLRLPHPEETGPRRSQQRQTEDLAENSPLGDRDFGRGDVTRSHLPHRLPGPPSLRNSTAAAVQSPERQSAFQPTDLQLEDWAQQALFRTGILSFSRLWVEVHQLRAVVFGTLMHDFELQLAMQTVRRVNGIRAVEHQVQVILLATDDDSLSFPSGKRRIVSNWVASTLTFVRSAWRGWRFAIFKASLPRANSAAAVSRKE